ncbi:hypothetical protein C8F01DRAFT_1276044 [Mycena amicta]|nr:hypothetical protein C8F01DRAFT_1276044 [Mycena amicta]
MPPSRAGGGTSGWRRQCWLTWGAVNWGEGETGRGTGVCSAGTVAGRVRPAWARRDDQLRGTMLTRLAMVCLARQFPRPSIHPQIESRPPEARQVMGAASHPRESVRSHALVVWRSSGSAGEDGERGLGNDVHRPSSDPVKCPCSRKAFTAPARRVLADTPSIHPQIESRPTEATRVIGASFHPREGVRSHALVVWRSAGSDGEVGGAQEAIGEDGERGLGNDGHPPCSDRVKGACSRQGFAAP